MEKNPFEKVLDQIAEIMQFAYDNAHKPVSQGAQEELDDKLAALEKQVLDFKEKVAKSKAEAGVSDYLVEAALLDEKGEGISPEDRKLLLRAEELKKEAKKASQDVIRAAADAQAAGAPLKKIKEKPQKDKGPQSRKGKFKSMGGYKDWKPL